MRPAPGYADYRTPIAGLYNASSATHAGGGVCGIPGWQAAKAAIADKKAATRRDRLHLPARGPYRSGLTGFVLARTRSRQARPPVAREVDELDHRWARSLSRSITCRAAGATPRRWCRSGWRSGPRARAAAPRRPVPARTTGAGPAPARPAPTGAAPRPAPAAAHAGVRGPQRLRALHDVPVRDRLEHGDLDALLGRHLKVGGVAGKPGSVDGTRRALGGRAEPPISRLVRFFSVAWSRSVPAYHRGQNGSATNRCSAARSSASEASRS